jgi:hypothetical protein
LILGKKELEGDVSFLGDKMTCLLMLNFVVLLTFGLASPLLGIVIIATICINCIIHRVQMGIYLKQLDLYNIIERVKLIDKYEIACSNAFLALTSTHAGVMILFSVSSFWAFLVFDMISFSFDYVLGRLIALITLIYLPLFIWLFLYKKFIQKFKKKLDNNDKDKVLDTEEL